MSNDDLQRALQSLTERLRQMRQERDEARRVAARLWDYWMEHRELEQLAEKHPWLDAYNEEA